MKVRVWTVTCPKCGVEMYSRAHHDFRVCGCPANMMVDGGFAGYVRYGAMPEYMDAVAKSFRHRFMKATRVELYDDWNYQRNKFGIIVVKKGAKTWQR